MERAGVDSPRHRELIDRAAKTTGTVMIIGGPDTGKSTFARRVLTRALGLGRSVALVDADIGHTTVGPPGCVGLKWVRSNDDLGHLHDADAVRFVGSTSPEGVVLQHVVATAVLCDMASQEAELVVLDTTGEVSGVVGQTLKYHKAETTKPMLAIAFQRGSELDPLAGMLTRFLGTPVAIAEPLAEVGVLSPTEQRQVRINAFRKAFEAPLQTWRVQPTVFAPTLPEGFDLMRLDGMLVGIQAADGSCAGLGALRYDVDHLTVITNQRSEMAGLRLGSMKIDLETFATSRVRLRQLIFGI